VTDEPRIEEPRIEEEQHAEETPVDELAAVTQERDEYLDALQRLKAEFDNYRKRVAGDQPELGARRPHRGV
jgi:molecular chaperone GrpE